MFTSTIKGEIRELFHVVVEQWRQRKIYRNANLNLLLFCRSRWRCRRSCVSSIIVTIEHRQRVLFMYTFLGHVNTNPDALKPNTWYFRLLEFGVVYPVWIHPLPHLFQSSTWIHQTRRIQKKNPFWRAVSKICSFGVRIHWFQGNAFYVACLRQDCFVGYKSYHQNREENCDVTLPW